MFYTFSNEIISFLTLLLVKHIFENYIKFCTSLLLQKLKGIICNYYFLPNIFFKSIGKVFSTVFSSFKPLIEPKYNF